MHVERTVIIEIIYMFIILALDWLYHYSYKNEVMRPIQKVIIRKLLKKYDNIEMLYRAYKELSTEEFKLVKLRLKSRDFESTSLQQGIDLISKLVLTVAFALMGVVITISASLLSYLKDNKELQADPDNNISKSITDVFGLFTKGMENYKQLFLISLFLCICAINHFYLINQKKRIRKEHLTIIDEIVEEKKEEKKATPPVEVPDQSQSTSSDPQLT